MGRLARQAKKYVLTDVSRAFGEFHEVSRGNRLMHMREM